MDLKNTPIYREITQVTQQTWNPPVFGWRGEIIANDVSYTVLRILSIDRIGNFVTAYADETYVKCLLPAGQYIQDIYPHRANLKFRLYREIVAGDDSVLQNSIVTQTLTAKVVEDVDAVKQADSPEALNREAANLSNLLAIELQLTDTLLEQARMTSLGGPFRNCKVGDLLKYLMKTTLDALDNEETGDPIAIDMVESSNNDIIPTIVVPAGTPLTDIADYLHQKVSGIYNAGLGYYLQRNCWYVYPPYDVTRFDESPRGLTVINIPKNKMPHMEKTYRITSKQVIVLATGETKHHDFSESNKLNDGNGVRFAEAGKFLGEFATVENNKAVAMRGENNSEFITSKNEGRFNNVKMSGKRVTSNMFLELSKLASRQGAYVEVEWQNADPDLITPGMPLRYFYYDGTDVCQIDGVVVGIHAFMQAPNPLMAHRRHIVSAALTLFIRRSTGEQSE